jgi:adenylate cyclase class 1
VTNKEIDPKQLKQMQERFTRLSISRLEKMLSGYNLTQSDSIRLLPLLFHMNSPILPGYIDQYTPCGIANYFPSHLEKTIAKTIKRSFKYQSRAYLKFEIASLYLMGSTGTLGQSVNSDLDLWVCISDEFEHSMLQRLIQKMTLISQWIAVRGVELNCYLVHQDDFSNKISKSISKDSCGDTQNFLLLDEFYRTAIWLCGRKPLWWLSPPEEDHTDYAKRLLNEKHVDSCDWIDFGEVDQIPASEYFSAALWQMYKAIESPYKSSLKLLLLEIYARHYPQSSLLSSYYKQQIYQGIEETEKLDPYLTILLYAEDFLRDQPQRLEFLRRAFYLKTGAKIVIKKKYPKNWRYQQIQQLVQRWNWNQSRLDYLNDRPGWKINAVLKEREDLVRELTHSYHFLSNFARVNGVQDNVSKKELLSLGRKLYVEFERRAGKIERVNTGIAKDVTENDITLFQKDNSVGQKKWFLLLGAVTKQHLAIRQPVYHADSFFDILSWCACNQVITIKTICQVYSDDSFYNNRYATSLIKNIFSLLNCTIHKIESGTINLLKPAEITKLGIFLNTTNDPLDNADENELYAAGSHLDIFCWGSQSINLLSQFHLLLANSWGEFDSKNYQGEFAWAQFFIEHYSSLDSEKCELNFYYGSNEQSLKIETRLLALFERWLRLKHNSQRKPKKFRYLMSYAKGFLLIDFYRGEITYNFYEQTNSFLYALTDHSNAVIEFHLDENLKLSKSIQRILKKPIQPDTNIYIIPHQSKILEVLLTDPLGNFCYQVHKGVSFNQLLNHYQQFFDSVDSHLGFLNQTPTDYSFWLQETTKSGLRRFKRIKLSDGLIASHYSKVQAIAAINSDGNLNFDLYIAEQAYRYQDYSELVFRKLAQHILKKRANNDNYPIFITDLDLSVLNHKATLIEYLEHKRVIEQKLERAIWQLTQKSN